MTTEATKKMECIYCRCATNGDEGEAHVFPEAIVGNDMALPRGMVCDDCNQYCGHELDTAVVRFPFIALAIQFLDLPGKKGKPRKEIGRIERLPEENAIRFAIQEPIIETKPDGSRSATVTTVLDKSFNTRRFRRSLHHIAFNLVAYERGAEVVLHQRFDSVRRYIRKPYPNEEWGFIQLVANLEQIRPVVQGRLVRNGPGETVCLRIFNHDFYVDLQNLGGLVPWAMRTIGPSVEIVEPGLSEAGLFTLPGERAHQIKLEK